MRIKIPSISYKMFLLILDSILKFEDNFKICFVNESTKQLGFLLHSNSFAKKESTNPHCKCFPHKKCRESEEIGQKWIL